jgi:hypothetical protein
MSMKSSQQAITHLVNAAPPPSELIFVGILGASAPPRETSKAPFHFEWL